MFKNLRDAPNANQEINKKASILWNFLDNEK